MGKKISTEKIPTLSQTITRNGLMILFLVVFFFSVLMGPSVTGTTLFFSVIKGFVAVALGWIFLLVISDALVRSIRASALDAKSSRREGGLLYHFLPPDSDELAEGEIEVPKPNRVKTEK